MKYLIYICSFGFLNLFGQTSINSIGGDVAGGGGSIAFSVGQIEYKKETGSQGFSYMGVQQPYEFFILNSVIENLIFGITISPNPVSDLLIVQAKIENFEELEFVLTDLSGKIIYSELIEQNKTYIDLQELHSGMYIITMKYQQKGQKSFKIIKK
jgi:hypothetical protein